MEPTTSDAALWMAQAGISDTNADTEEPLPAPAVPMEQLVSLEAMAAEKLRPMILALFEENHQLRNRLQRSNLTVKHLQEALHTTRGRYTHIRSQDTGQYQLREHEEDLEQEVRELFVLFNEQKRLKPHDQKRLNAADRRLKEELKLNVERSERLHLSQRTTDMLKEMLLHDPSEADNVVASELRPSTATAPAPLRAPPRGPRTAHAVLHCSEARDVGSPNMRPSTVCPAAPSVLKKEPPLHITVKIMPGAVVTSATRVDKVSLKVYGAAFVADVKDLLEKEGVAWGHLSPACWGPLDDPENQGVQEARLLFQGMPLRTDIPLKEQGIRDGSELRLLRARVYPHKLRSRTGHEHGSPRGLLMNPGTPAWRTSLVRTGPNAFFESMQPEYGRQLAHLTTLALAKVEKTEPLYSTI